jgi:thioredoxin 1
MSISVDSHSQFKQLIKQNSRCVVKFGATWCTPCKRFAPEFERLAKNHSDVLFISIDVDENPDTANELKVGALPTFVFYKNEKIMHTQQGVDLLKFETSLQYLKV